MTNEYEYDINMPGNLTGLADFIAYHRTDARWTLDTSVDGTTFVRSDRGDVIVMISGTTLRWVNGQFVVGDDIDIKVIPRGGSYE